MIAQEKSNTPINCSAGMFSVTSRSTVVNMASGTIYLSLVYLMTETLVVVFFLNDVGAAQSDFPASACSPSKIVREKTWTLGKAESIKLFNHDDLSLLCCTAVMLELDSPESRGNLRLPIFNSCDLIKPHRISSHWRAGFYSVLDNLLCVEVQIDNASLKTEFSDLFTRLYTWQRLSCQDILFKRTPVPPCYGYDSCWWYRVRSDTCN